MPQASEMAVPVGVALAALFIQPVTRYCQETLRSPSGAAAQQEVKAAIQSSIRSLLRGAGKAVVEQAVAVEVAANLGLAVLVLKAVMVEMVTRVVIIPVVEGEAEWE